MAGKLADCQGFHVTESANFGLAIVDGRCIAAAFMDGLLNYMTRFYI